MKFYTEEGNYDLIGNNHPVFFIQDAIKFPDLVQSFKPEPQNEIPQATNAHNTFWNFHANNTEASHHAIWAMSPRGVPRSFRMMEGFGVHTYRLINDEGEATFVKFHWRPKLGVHGLEWEEAQMIAGNDPDFNRKDVYNAIEDGIYPEWELGIQIITDEDIEKFEGKKVRAEGAGFKDHFSQPSMFYNSMSDWEKEHIIGAYSFELGKCDMSIRQKNVDNVLANIDLEMAQAVAKNIEATPPTEGGNDYDKVSPALCEDTYPHLPDTRKVGILIADGFDETEVKRNIDAFDSANVNFEIVSEMQGVVTGSDGMELEADHTFDTTDAVLYDALYVVGGPDLSKTFKKETKKFINKTFDHFKAIGAPQAGIDMLEKLDMTNQPGVLTEGESFADDFVDAITTYRHRSRDVEEF